MAERTYQGLAATVDLPCDGLVTVLGADNAALLARMLGDAPRLRGVLAVAPDDEAAAEGARRTLAHAGDRAAVIRHCDGLPQEATAYVLPHVLRALANPGALALLRSIAAVARPGAVVVVAAAAMADGRTHPWPPTSTSSDCSGEAGGTATDGPSTAGCSWRAGRFPGPSATATTGPAYGSTWPRPRRHGRTRGARTEALCA